MHTQRYAGAGQWIDTNDISELRYQYRKQLGSAAEARAGLPRPAFPAFLAGAGRPLLHSLIDYSLFSELLRRAGQLFPVKFGLRVISLSSG
jgi:hypothetical protein